MHYYDTDKAIELMREHDERADFVGGASNEAIRAAQERLGVEFPPSYRRFLEELGAGRFGEQLWYGVVDGGAGSEYDVVAHTLEQRTRGHLPETHFVVGKYGEEAYFAVDCADVDEDDECPVARVPRDYDDIEEPNYVEEDFGGLLLARVCDILGVRERFMHP